MAHPSQAGHVATFVSHPGINLQRQREKEEPWQGRVVAGRSRGTDHTVTTVRPPAGIGDHRDAATDRPSRLHRAPKFDARPHGAPHLRRRSGVLGEVRATPRALCSRLTAYTATPRWDAEPARASNGSAHWPRRLRHVDYTRDDAGPYEAHTAYGHPARTEVLPRRRGGLTRWRTHRCVNATRLPREPQADPFQGIP